MEYNLNSGWLNGKGSQMEYLIQYSSDPLSIKSINLIQTERYTPITPLSRYKKLDYYLDQLDQDYRRTQDTTDLINRSKNTSGKKLRDWIKRSNKLWIVGSNGKGIIIQ